MNVGVAYGSDTELVRRTLLGVAAAEPEVVRHEETTVVFRDFGDSSLEFTLIFWVAEAREQMNVASDVRFAIDGRIPARRYRDTVPATRPAHQVGRRSRPAGRGAVTAAVAAGSPSPPVAGEADTGRRNCSYNA